MIKERKRTYTQEEVNELKKWFDSQELPPTMQIDKAALLGEVPENQTIFSTH